MSAATQVAVDATRVSSTFDARLEPVLTIDDGATVRVETRSILSHVDTRDPAVFAAIADHSHMDIPVTGPIAVRGARVGDVLRVDLHEVEIADHGAMVTLVGRGGFTEALAPTGLLLPIRDEHVHFDDIALPVRPMVGKIGLGTSDAPHCSTVGRHGGNMDCTAIGPGTTLYLPVLADGALLFVGDLHARQGDGEACLTGVEVEGAVVATCRVIRDWPLERPVVVTGEHTVTIGDGDDLDEAVRLALDDMLALVRAERGWSREHAAMFLSAAADVAVCQVVNARKSARVSLAHDLLPITVPPNPQE
ncbi:acetamidase/formamidase family protein [Nocardioides ginsengisoli]|uniref:Acetamidase/formamidase family protein n=1 Tax=Nocardioides ginsengisoli TaxID=363868 RepID=A0ABW3VV78_9ACTN